MTRARRKRRAAKPSVMQQDVESFVMSSALARAAEYAQRGRFFASVSQEQLVEKWCAAFRDLFDPHKRALENDLASEFELRGIERPFDLVRDEIEVFTSAVTSADRAEAKGRPGGF
jgi:hypothetical protein